MTASETFTGDVYFVPNDQTPIPDISELQLAPAVPAVCQPMFLALAGALLFGFGFRRKTRRWLALTVVAVGAFAAAGGRKKDTMMPETYNTPSRRITD